MSEENTEKKRDLGSILLDALGARRISDLEAELDAEQAKHPYPQIVYAVERIETAERINPGSPPGDPTVQYAFTVRFSRKSPRFGDGNDPILTWHDAPANAREYFRPGRVFTLSPIEYDASQE